MRRGVPRSVLLQQRDRMIKAVMRAIPVMSEEDVTAKMDELLGLKSSN